MIVKAIYFQSEYIEILAQNPHPPQIIRRGNESIVTYGDVQSFRLQDEAYNPKRKLKDMDAAGVDLALTKYEHTTSLHADLLNLVAKGHKP